VPIKLVRVDDRLIHGQVVVGWSCHLDIDTIIVIDDMLGSDNFQKEIMLMSVPEDLAVFIFNIEEAVEKIREGHCLKKNTILLFRNMSELIKVMEKGLVFKNINIGRISYREGKKRLTDSVYVNDADLKEFAELLKKGLDIEVREYPDAPVCNLNKLLEDKEWNI